MMKTIELLAPAKDLAVGIAAIQHGADAVYIGPPRFGARAAASNTIEDIEQLCRFAHLFDVKVYATINTLLYDDELAEAQRIIVEMKRVGVDACLLQDMRLVDVCKQVGMEMHASTQTDNRTAEKVRQLSAMGFTRVVLARELTLEEIAAIHAEMPDTELEVFVHGALCVSLSGLCYASEYCFGRSANRGECAQVCRMKFDLIDAQDSVVETQRHLLSLKDLNQSRYIEDIVEAGAVALKIEGRLKDIAYVKNVTAAYSQLLNKFIAQHPSQYRRASRGTVDCRFHPDLSRTFNRGYTNYFLHGRTHNIWSPDTPKAIGQFVGKVKEIGRSWFSVAGTASFVNGDGLCFFANRDVNNIGELTGFRVNRAEGNKLFPQNMPHGLRQGMPLYRSNDQEMERILSRDSASRHVEVDMALAVNANTLTLTIDDVSANIDVEVQEAKTPQHDNIVRQLTKLGDTPLRCKHLELPNGFNGFIPSSILAQLRRKAVEAWMAKRNGRTEHPDGHSLMGDSASFIPVLDRPVARPAGSETMQHKDSDPLMQCWHCIRYAMGYCVRNGGQRPRWKEPLTLQLANGMRFRLEFDCKNCQMNVYATE